MVSFAIQQSNSLFLVFILGRESRLIIRTHAATRDEINAQESQRTPSNELCTANHRHRVEITVENRTADDHGEGEQDKLGRNHLCRVKALESTVDIPDLHQCTKNEDEDEEIGDGECNDMPQRE